MKCPKCDFQNTRESRFCSNCGTEIKATKDDSFSYTKTLITKINDLSVGSTFADRYYIMEDLGKGGMGRVFKVLDTKIDEKVALKLLNPDVASDEKTKERFRNELKLTRKITHRNICRVYDFSEEQGYPYITMEYVPGEDLKSLIRRIGQFTVGKAVFIAKQVCEGLTEAHKQGVVHRDLKPQNIMIDRDGNARILDFGIARSVKTKGITDAGAIVGTPEYMSPEQVEGKEVDQRSDIYSLGIILYEMVTGRVPFEGDTPISVAVKQKTEKPQDPAEFNIQIPNDLSRIILKCLEKDKNRRYQKTADLLDDLREIEKNVPTTDRVLPQRKPITSREITVKFNLRKLYVPLLVVLAVVLLGVVGWRLISNPKFSAPDEGKPSLAVMYFENNTGYDGLDTWEKALSDLLIADLSQSKYLNVLSGEKLLNILEELGLLNAETYSFRDLQRIAERGGVKYTLVGKITQAGNVIRVNTSLQEAQSGKQIGSEMVEGIGKESLFEIVDTLTRRVKASFKLTQEEIAADIDKAVENITTTSPEAARYYQEGIKAHSKGDYTECIALMDLAVGLDPNFAMAYRSMALAYENLGYKNEAQKKLKQAFDLADKVSDREKFYIQGQYYMQSESNYDKAIETYQKLLDSYPDDEIGRNNLAILYIRLEKWEEAQKLLQGNISQGSEGIQSYLNLAQVYMARGLMDEAQNVLESFLNNVYDNATIHESLAHNYLWKSEFSLASVEAEHAFRIDPLHHRNFLLKGDIRNYLGDISGSEREYQNLLNTPEPTAHNQGLNRLVNLYLFQGRFKEALELARQGIELADLLGEKSWLIDYNLTLALIQLELNKPEEALKACNQAWEVANEQDYIGAKREILISQGLSYLSLGKIDQAETTSRVLKSLCEESLNNNVCRYYSFLQGRIEHKKRNYSEAVRLLKETEASIPSPYFGRYFWAMTLDSLGQVYLDSSDLQNAKIQYDKLTALPQGRVHWGNIYVEGFFMLAKIYDENNIRPMAVRNYQRFLDLWKNADPNIQEVAQSEERLSELQMPLSTLIKK